MALSLMDGRACVAVRAYVRSRCLCLLEEGWFLACNVWCLHLSVRRATGVGRCVLFTVGTKANKGSARSDGTRQKRDKSKKCNDSVAMNRGYRSTVEENGNMGEKGPCSAH